MTFCPPFPLERINFSTRSFSRILILLTAAWACIFIGVGSFSAYWADLRNDQYQLIHLGQCVYNGQRMYIDCWENKPPGIAWINALGVSLTGGRELGAWLLPALSALLCLAVAGYWMARLLSVTAACGTILLASLIGTLRLYDAPSVSPDFYSSAFELAACSLWLVSLEAPRRRRRVCFGLAAGLVWAASAAVKQTGFVGLLAVTTVAIVLTVLKRADRRRWLTAGGFAWIGFVLGAAAVVLVLFYRQTLGPAWAAIVESNRGLLSFESFAASLGAWSRTRAGLEPLQLPLWLGLLAVIATLHTGRTRCLSRPLVGALLLWWVAQVVLALMGPSRSMRYWQATFPAMLWLTGMGIYHLEETFQRLGKGHRTALGVVCATVVLLLAQPLVEHYKYGLATSYLSYSDDRQRDRLEFIGQEVQALVLAEEPIYIWAYDAGVYVYAARRPASRFTYPRSSEQMGEILADLEAGEAFALLIPKKASAEFERWCDDTCHQQLADILTVYEMITTLYNYEVWVRSSDVEDDPSSLPE